MASPEDIPEDIHRAIVEAAPDAILVVDPEGTIVLVNRHAEHLFGYERSALLGSRVERLVPARSHDKHRRLREGYQDAPRTRRLGDDERDLYGVRSDGNEVAVDIALSPLRTADGVFTIAIVRDATERVAHEDRLRYMSAHDPLTGLYNRAYFETEKERFAKGRALPVSVIVLDIDGLKAINDRFGHAAGDKLLERLAVVLRDCFRVDDVVARLGGDEFGILLPGLDEEAAQAALGRFDAALAQHNEIHRGRRLSVSRGIATALKGSRLTEALRLADMRMYDEKRTRAGNRESVA